jgi:hypothetical protein
MRFYYISLDCSASEYMDGNVFLEGVFSDTSQYSVYIKIKPIKTAIVKIKMKILPH